MKAKDLDKIFDAGEVDFTECLDLAKAFKPGQEQKRVNVDFPVWMLERIDKEAGRLGVPRQSLIKVWIGEKLKKGVSKKRSKAVVQNG
jgi:predicted DNA binding CopG/RHH family protein